MTQPGRAGELDLTRGTRLGPSQALVDPGPDRALSKYNRRPATSASETESDSQFSEAIVRASRHGYLDPDQASNHHRVPWNSGSWYADPCPGQPVPGAVIRLQGRTRARVRTGVGPGLPIIEGRNVRPRTLGPLYAILRNAGVQRGHGVTWPQPYAPITIV